MGYALVEQQLLASPRTWCVTGAAGFIGSHITTTLLKLNQTVRALDNFSTGSRANLEAVQRSVSPQQWARFTLIEGDIRNPADCANAVSGCEFLSHQAALGSVPRSIADPALSTAVNVDGFVQMLLAAKDAGVKRIIYASSSSVYGDSPDLPKFEHRIGKPLSPYALTKVINEQYAAVFARCYGTETVGMRYFNVFGPRQDPNGPYAAVLPRWIAALRADQRPVIYGDGETSRDFCYVANVVEANILAAISENPHVVGAVFNIACGEQNSLNATLASLTELLGKTGIEPIYAPFRNGDVRHSLADIAQAQRVLGYTPKVKLAEGLRIFVESETSQ